MTFEERLAKAVLAFGQTSELPDLLGKICSQCQALFGVHGVYLWQKQDKDLVGVAACGYMEEHFVGSYAMLSEAVFAAAVARQGHAQLSANYQKEEIYTKHFPPKEGLVSLLGLPLSSDGAVEGVLVMADTEIEDRFTIDDVEQATQFCEHAAAAVRRCRNLLDTKDQIDQLKISISQQESQLNQERKRVHYLYRLTDELSEVMDQDSVIRIVLELVSEVTGSSQSAILTVDTSSGKFSYPSAYRTQGIHPLTGAIEDHGLHWKIAKRVVETRASVIAVQKGSDSQELRIPDGLGLGSAIGVPLMAKEEVAGVLLLFHEDPKAFSEDQVPLIEAAAYQVGTNIRNAQLFTLIRHQTERLGQLLRQESISAAKSKAILECIADGVVVVDALGIVTLANVAAKEFLSLTNQELIGRRVSDHKNLYALFGDKWTEVARDWARGSSPDQSHSFLAHTLELNQKYVGVQLSPIFANEKYL
ncbi:MAG: GAF domain-containing protein [Candidatus Promineifilaceae bacterium]